MKIGEKIIALGKKIIGQTTTDTTNTKDEQNITTTNTINTKSTTSSTGGNCWWLFNKPTTPKIFKDK